MSALSAVRTLNPLAANGRSAGYAVVSGYRMNVMDTIGGLGRRQ